MNLDKDIHLPNYGARYRRNSKALSLHIKEFPPQVLLTLHACWYAID